MGWVSGIDANFFGPTKLKSYKITVVSSSVCLFVRSFSQNWLQGSFWFFAWNFCFLFAKKWRSPIFRKKSGSQIFRVFRAKNGPLWPENGQKIFFDSESLNSQKKAIIFFWPFLTHCRPPPWTLRHFHAKNDKNEFTEITCSKVIRFGWNFQEMIISWLLGKIWTILIILAKSCPGMPKICPNLPKIQVKFQNWA